MLENDMLENVIFFLGMLLSTVTGLALVVVFWERFKKNLSSAPDRSEREYAGVKRYVWDGSKFVEPGEGEEMRRKIPEVRRTLSARPSRPITSGGSSGSIRSTHDNGDSFLIGYTAGSFLSSSVDDDCIRNHHRDHSPANSSYESNGSNDSGGSTDGSGGGGWD